MDKFLKIIKKLYWLGFIGLIGTFKHIRFLEYFYLFFILGIVDLILSLAIITKYEDDNDNEDIINLKFLFQNLGMLFGIPIIYIKNLFRLPNVKSYKPEVLYSLPFKGKWLVANGGIDKTNSHSWYVCNQRYAYDFYILENEKSFKGDGRKVTDYNCYGEPILSPADGIVVEIKNLFNDTPIPEVQEAICACSDIRGNYIVIKHSENEYSTIAHIKKDSFCVNVGESVKRGQKIALCGNSGNTSEPHIHFQIQQGKSFLLSASLPISFIDIKSISYQGERQFISRGQFVESQIE